jgi:RNA polymerase sigma-70 factor (ECF subfamily)
VGHRQEQFERGALPHLESLLRFARRLTGHDSAARDLVQETFLQAWRAFDRLRPDSNLRAWLFRILMHVSYDAGRRARRSVPIVPLSYGLAVPAASRADSLEVLEALDLLPVDQRTVLILAAVEGFTCREASEILGVPQGTVMSRLSRARQAMRAALAPETEKPETEKALL